MNIRSIKTRLPVTVLLLLLMAPSLNRVAGFFILKKVNKSGMVRAGNPSANLYTGHISANGMVLL